MAAARPAAHAPSWAPPPHLQHQQQQVQQQRQQQQVQQQLLQAPAPPTNVIPVQEFPVVPTEVPHAQQQQYAMYAGAGTGGLAAVQEERKEGLLIDL